MAFKPIDNKRDQFRKYLEASGVIEVLSKSITKLMETPEKPESPVDFIRANMGLTQKELNQIEFLKEEVEIYKKQVNDLKLEIAGLKQERQEVENGLSKEVVPDATTVKDDVVVAVSDNQNNKQIEVETKKTEDVESTPVVAAVATDDVQKIQKIDKVEEVSADVSAVAQATDAKIETKPEEIKADDKQAAAAAAVVVAAAATAGDAAPEATDVAK